MQKPSSPYFDLNVFNILLEEIRELKRILPETRLALSHLMENKRDEEVLTFKQAQVYLKLSKKAFLQLEKNGQIIPKRIGSRGIKRYYKQDLMIWLRSSPKNRKQKVD